MREAICECETMVKGFAAMQRRGCARCGAAARGNRARMLAGISFVARGEPCERHECCCSCSMRFVVSHLWDDL